MLHKKKNSLSAGGVLLTTLVIFLLFLVMMFAAINYINRQYKAVTNQREQQKAFRLAESGVDYVLFVLRKNVNTIPGLLSAGASSAQSVLDPVTGVSAGTFTLTYSATVGGSATESMDVVSKGTTAGNASCETVAATVEHGADASFTVTSWRHDLGCN